MITNNMFTITESNSITNMSDIVQDYRRPQETLECLLAHAQCAMEFQTRYWL